MNRILFLIFFLYINISYAQEQLGLHLENYAGINAVSINPANSFLTPHRWDANIISAGAFFENNYGFLKNTNTAKLYRSRANPDIKHDSTNNIQTVYPRGTVIYDFYDKKRKSYVSISGNMTGPSFTIKLDKNNSIGFISGFRFIGGVQNIPSELNYYTYFNKPFFQAFPITSFTGGLLSWQEYGLNYVKKIKGYSTITLLGGTIKYLSGNEAMFFDDKHSSIIQQIRGDSLAVLDRMDMQYGYTNTIFKSNLLRFKQNGIGASIDLGATILFGEKINDYNFRIGVSLLDLGFINFNKNALKYRINIDTLAVIDLEEFKNIDQISKLDSVSKILSQQIFNDPDKTLEANSFSMRLPGALSIQFDYSFSKMFYINAILIQRLTTKKYSIIRNNLFAVSPRIEHRWFSVSTPLVIYDWKSIRIGTSVRLAYLTIGSDNILTLFTNNAHYTGSDFYIGLKFNPFLKGKKRKRHPNLNKNIKCYEFK